MGWARGFPVRDLSALVTSIRVSGFRGKAHRKRFLRRHRLWLGWWWLVWAGLFGLSLEAQSYRTVAPNRVLNPVFQGIRPMAMGNAFTAVADDQNALWYNPAGLARRKTWSLEILSPYVGGSGSLSDFVDNVQKISKLSNFTSDAEQFEEFRSVMTKIQKEEYYARAGLSPTFVMHNFGIGAYAQFEALFVPHEFGESLMEVNLVTDIDARMAGGYTFFGEKLSWGMALGVKARGLVSEEISFDLLDKFQSGNANDELKKMLKFGWGIAADTGVLFTPIEMWSPTFGLAIQNIGDVKMRETQATSKYSGATPDPIPQSVNMGFSITPTLNEAKTLFARVSTDFRNMNLPYPASQKWSLGLETGYNSKWVSATLQGGLYQGYLTGGFETRLLLLNIRYATWAEQLGYSAVSNGDRNYANYSQRRHMVQLKLLF